MRIVTLVTLLYLPSTFVSVGNFFLSLSYIEEHVLILELII